MRVAIVTVVITLLAVTASAQDAPFFTLEELRKEYPETMTHEQRGELLNRVAWLHRIDGWGLHLKPSGNRCPQPGGVEISCDILVHGPTQAVYDVLIDENTPTWRLIGPINTMSNFVRPTGNDVPFPAPKPLPTPPPSGPTLTQIQSSIDTLVAIVGEFEQKTITRLDALDAKAVATQKLLETHHLTPPPAVVPNVPINPAPISGTPDTGSTLTRTFVFIGKYVLPAIGGLAAGIAASRGEQ